jgi:Winged helix-turn helix
MIVIAMSRSEIDRMSVLHDLADGGIKLAEASKLMGLGRRQVFRLAKAYGKHGPKALMSRGAAGRANVATRRLCVRSDWHHQGAVLRLWPYAGGGEACGAAPDSFCA